MSLSGDDVMSSSRLNKLVLVGDDLHVAVVEGGVSLGVGHAVVQQISHGPPHEPEATAPVAVAHFQVSLNRTTLLYNYSFCGLGVIEYQGC